MDPNPLIASAWLKPDYRSALERAGARVRDLTPADQLPDALVGCDGVLLTGGVDVDPVFYGESDRHPSVETDQARDDYELALARIALEQNLPVLAICRGAQVLNVAAGGTLVQDIPSASPDALPHQHEPKDHLAHAIDVTPGTCLSLLLTDQLTSGQPVLVNSRHHQSVKTVGDGFVVSATAPDGVVEAIEKPSADFCMGVQWHPENFWQTGRFGSLFDGLVEAARRRRQSGA